MRFLRVLRLGRILAGAVGQILLVETVADRLARRRNGFAGHLYAIGPHIGDEAVLIELLGEAHRMAGGEMQLYEDGLITRSEEHTSELQSLMRISYAVFCLKKKKNNRQHQ